MDKMQSFLEKKVTPLAVKLGSIPQLVAIRDGLAYIMPLILIGSLALLLGNLPITADWYTHLLNQGGWTERLNIIVNGSFGIIGLIGAFCIAYSLGKQWDLEPISNGVLSIAAFLISTPLIIAKDGTNSINLDLMGSKGLFVAIVIGFIVPEVFKFCKKHNFVIKMPDGVPPAVGDSFAALIPGLIIMVLFAIIYWILSALHLGSLHDIVQLLIGKPFSLLGASVFGMIIYELGISLFWLCGIHGGNIVGSIMNPMWMQKMDENRKALQMGHQLPNIFTQPFFDLFVHIGGAGTILGLAIVIVLFARSEQYKSFGRLSIIPAIFNISEPVMFGLPVVLNPIMFIPFTIVPIISGLLTWLGMVTGLVVKTNGISVPWTTPPLISGYLATGSFSGVIMQVVVITVACAIYYPFFRVLDNQALKAESEKL